MAIHQDDYEAVINLSTMTAVTDEFQAKYSAWLHAFHSRGNSGPLGDLLIPLLDSLGVLREPPTQDVDTSDVNWRDLPTDGTVRIEVDMYGAWQPGTFYGVSEAGILICLLDDEDERKEYHTHAVKLGERLDPDMVDVTPPIVDDGEPDTFDMPEGEDIAPDDDEINWETVAEGTAVSATTRKGATVKGKFIRSSEGGLIVEAKGRQAEVPAEDVVLIPQNPTEA